MRFADFLFGGAALSGAIPPGRKHFKDFSLGNLIDLTPFDMNRFKLKPPSELLAQFDSTSSRRPPWAPRPGPPSTAPDPAPAPSPNNDEPAKPSNDEPAKPSNPEPGQASHDEVGKVSNPNKVDATPSDSSRACKSASTRVEWRNLQEQDRHDYVAAARCLMDKPSEGSYQGSHSRHEDLVWVHQQMTVELHGFATFLPWHRRFLNVYETMLREECDFRGPMPWWDETRDAGNFTNAPLFTPEYFGTALRRTSDGRGTCVTDGAFAGVTMHVGPGGGFSDHCLSRAVDETLTKEVSQATIDTVHHQDNFQSFWGLTEGWPHAYGHNGMGAIMSDVGPSPGDPLFFMHHAFVDRNWWRWQNADRSARVYQITGRVNDKDTPISLEYVLSTRGLKQDVTVSDVMDTIGDSLCYNYDY